MPCGKMGKSITNAFLESNCGFVFTRNQVNMKKTPVLVLSLVALAINLSGCEKTPEEKMAGALSQATSDKEIKRLNEIRKQGDEAFDKLLGPKKSSSTESEKPTKSSDSKIK